MKKLIIATTLVLLTYSSTAGGLIETVTGIFDVSNTNGIIHAQSLDVTPTFTWDSQSEKYGGTLKLGWWISQQNGSSFWFYENEDREQFWSLSYDTRTVFQKVELGLSTGIIQPMASNLGNDLRAYLQPNMRWRFSRSTSLYSAAMLTSGDRPRFDVGLSFTFGR